MHTGAPTGGVHQDQGGVWRRQRPQRRFLPPVRQGGRPRDGIGGGGRSAEGALLWWKRCGTQASARSLSGTLGSGSGCPKLRRAANTNQRGSRWPATPCVRHRRAGRSSASAPRAARRRMRRTRRHARSGRSGRVSRREAARRQRRMRRLAGRSAVARAAARAAARRGGKWVRPRPPAQGHLCRVRG